jgi:hypothetical protein
LLNEQLREYEELFKSGETPEPLEYESGFGSPTDSRLDRNNAYESPLHIVN